MATLTANGLTLTEVAKRQHDGNMLTIAEVLEKTVEIMEDIPWVESNDTWSNVAVRRASLPGGEWRKLNAGVSTEKSDTTQVRDVIGLLETRSENDIEIINSFPSPKQARFDEDSAFAMGLSQTMASSVIYANTDTDPEKFTGLAPRMDSLATSQNVLNEGGTGSDLTSIYVVDWGPMGCYMVYPKNAMAGLRMDDLGIETVTDSNSKKFRAYVSHFVWKAGLVVRDPRSIGRIANIETAGSSNIFDEDSLITLLNRMTKSPGLRIYCNETIMTQAEIRLKDKTNVNWSVGQGLGGVPFMQFRNIPVRKIDSQILLNTESALT